MDKCLASLGLFAKIATRYILLPCWHLFLLFENVNHYVLSECYIAHNTSIVRKEFAQRYSYYFSFEEVYLV